MNVATARTTAPRWNAEVAAGDSARYARCIEVSRRVRWDIDADVIRGRDFDHDRTFLPAGLSLVDRIDFLDGNERRFFSQVQGRTYAWMFGLCERFIGAKMLQTSGQHWLGDQSALEALVRFSDEEIKHQELFRRLEVLLEARMPPGHAKMAEANTVAMFVMARSNWAVLALIFMIELFVQRHYEESIAPSQELCPLWKDVFLFHFREECQHSVVDELELRAEDARIDEGERDVAIDDLIALLGAMDDILRAQADADAAYFVVACGRPFGMRQQLHVVDVLRRAYRWQYIGSGVRHPRFVRVLDELATPQQRRRLDVALESIVPDV
ncbi:hypothetical protein [Lysobacter sp. FW306-1B-D06B]|uniref:hypothetical protein n=1 Tax=Lysobacter sp. FW306-1B-D06B TaxID=3140250 RepID=UPI0031404BA3